MESSGMISPFSSITLTLSASPSWANPISAPSAMTVFFASLMCCSEGSGGLWNIPRTSLKRGITEHPISLRFYVDLNKPHSINKRGKVSFTIGKAVLCVKGREITNKFEQKLAWFIMLYGRWEKSEKIAHVENDKLQYVEMAISPAEPVEKQGFDIIDSLSSMLSRQYVEHTSSKGEIRKLIPSMQPDEMGVFIPQNYKGDVLHLWRFELQPNYNSLKKV